MEYIRANIKKRFTLRNSEWKLYTLEFLKWDEYRKDEFTDESYEILKNYKTFGVYSFTVVNTWDIQEKKAETLDSSDIRALYEAKTGKKFPPNKTRKNKDTWEIWIDEEWARKKLEELEKWWRMD